MPLKGLSDIKAILNLSMMKKRTIKLSEANRVFCEQQCWDECWAILNISLEKSQRKLQAF